MDFNDLLDTTFFGLSLRWLLIFCTKAAVIYILIRIVTAIVKYFFRRSMKRQGNIVLDETRIGFVRQIIVVAVYVIGVSAILSLIPGMEKVSTSILASAGIGVMAVGLAAQAALSNIIGGLFIIFSRPFKVGDYIMVDDIIKGTVTEITLRHTVIKNAENRMILVPNSTMNSSTIINSSFSETDTCAFVEVGVSYNTDLDHAISVMRDEIMKHPMLIDHRTQAECDNGTPQVIIRVINLGDSAITLRAWVWAKNTSNAFVMNCELMKAIKERFDNEGIEIPYPYFNQIVTKA